MARLVAHNIADLRLAAKARLPRGLFDYVDRGTEEELSLHSNRKAFDSIQFLPRPLVDVSTREQSTDLLNSKLAMPLVIAPTGMAGMLWHQGEIAIARAAKAAGVPFTLSTYSITPIEEVGLVGGDLWFQLYLWPSMDMSLELVKRAQKAGYKALVVTVDSVVNGNREHNRRNGFSVPMRLTPRNIWDGALHPSWTLGVMGRYMLTSGIPEFANFPKDVRSDLRGRTGGNAPATLPKNESQNWSDIRRLRQLWQGPLIVKGILHPLDAINAIDCGADGIVVSNHGGRALDGALAPLQALPAIVAAVSGRARILLDGAVVRGSDVVKAIALGADAVMVGRAPLWGVAAGGEAGVALALATYRNEIDRVMAYLGCRSIAEIHRDLLYHEGPHATAVFKRSNI